MSTVPRSKDHVSTSQPTGQLPTPISAGPESHALAHDQSHLGLYEQSLRTQQATSFDHSQAMTSPYSLQRSLPSLSFTNDQAFEDAYAQFILYCNPGISQDVNTHDLRKNFASPPRSDSKTFSTRRLFELLQQLDRKELKTWTELALKLGVEKPSIEKGQSSQKVQQYSVRLKRWLRASHIDAFFDYMMGKSHSYLEVPAPHDPFPEQRDGVFAEDDLALRALKPEFRPKRGRKRAESDEIEPMSAIEPKRPHLDPAFHDSAYPHSAYPGSVSGHPDGMDRFQHDQWPTPVAAGSLSAIPNTSPGQNRWRFNDTPSTPHPASAVTPLTAQPPDLAFDDESLSQSQKMKMRRRHGTAVSSAWPSNSITPNGKLRGRPPTNRSVKDGPFISFPANPNAKEGPSIDLSRNLASTPVDDSRQPESAHTNSPFRIPAYPTPISATIKVPGKPERLSVTVPQHTGNPVRLVTPTLTINGESDQSGFNDLLRALAADLLQADIVGRTKPFRGTEAKDLAQTLLASLVDQRSDSHDDVDKLTVASWLGLSPPSSINQRWSSVNNTTVKKITARTFQLNTDGYYVPVEHVDRAVPELQTKETFDVEWELSLGSLVGRFQIKGLVIGISPPTTTPEVAMSSHIKNNEGNESQQKSWEQRYEELEESLRQSNEQIRALKDKVLEAVL